MGHEALQFGLGILMTVAVGMSIVIVVSQERTRATALLAGATLMVGLAIGTVPIFLNRVDVVHPELGARLQGVFEVGAILTYGSYMLALLAASSLSRTRTRVVRTCGLALLALGIWHAVASSVWPAERLNDYMLSLGEPGALSRPGFWLFAAFWLVAVVPYSIGWGLLAWGELDPAEARRARSAAVASAAAIIGTFLPPTFAALIFALWICVVVYGQFQYVSARAERGVFLSRFLSPRVTELVATRGLSETMKPHNADITVVSADLRGFTSYSEGVPSQAVVDLLTDYYDAVGEVAARHGATITNYAGDGVLILVGAPIADANHAATAVQLARELLVAVEPVVVRWQTRVHTLGLGVGVASGVVTVGAISAKTRMEYTAIGMPVNLAARLCAAALADEILVDAEAARMSKDSDLTAKGEMIIKGFSAAQHVYAAN